MSDMPIGSTLAAAVDSQQAAVEQVAAAIQTLAQNAYLPRATYRLQFNEQFTFRDALAIVPYLDSLGISDVYASPIFKSRSGSTHGYDVCDHGQLNPVLGTSADFDALVEALHARGMGILLDTVPNHMGVGDPCNAWWQDVLENGSASPYATYFDIDWHPIKPELDNKVLLPILGEQYGIVLENGQFQLKYADGAFTVYYYETQFPIEPCTYATILSEVATVLSQTLLPEASGAPHEAVQELQSILTALNYLPSRLETDPAKRIERNREKEVIKRRIAALTHAQPAVTDAIAQTLVAFNGQAGDPRSFDKLDALLEGQPYRAAYWQVAAEEINYRRFFDVNELAAIRVELPEVFDAVHRLSFEMLAAGEINGFRVDHPDGLWNPPVYFRQLQERYLLDQLTAHSQLAAQNTTPADAGAANAALPLANEAAQRQAIRAYLTMQSQVEEAAFPLYVIVEKILSETEPLPPEWTVHGTTGYDFVSAANNLFVDSSAAKTFDGIYSHFIGRTIDFEQLVSDSKAMIMRISLSSEINTLGRELERINEQNRRYRDFTLNGLIDALREVIVCLPIYRTYTVAGASVSPRDRQYLEGAIAKAKRRSPQTASSVYDFVRDVLLLRNLNEFAESARPQVVNFVMKFQQVTGPVMAKSVEDTAFYVYNRLVSLNEVGGQPRIFGLSLDAFHRQNSERRRRWPHAMLATSTHDTKRSEDVRVRISILSEMPREWNAALTRWKRLNAAQRITVDGDLVPDRNEEYLLYQTLIGAWPLEPYTPEMFDDFRERIAAYMLKASKEAKVHSGWLNPNPTYDEALQKFVRDVLSDTPKNRFLPDIRTFQQRIARGGQLNALAQQALKLTSPGVPDVYQGTELWTLSLVDPDNRRPVDYPARQAFLSDLQAHIADPHRPRATLLSDLIDHAVDGRIKLYLTYCILNYRRTHAALFNAGDYQPLIATGDKAQHVCAFSRNLHSAGSQGESLIVAVPRLINAIGSLDHLLPDAWGATWLPLPDGTRRYRNLLTGEMLEIAQHAGMPAIDIATLFKQFPVAVLVAE